MQPLIALAFLAVIIALVINAESLRPRHIVYMVVAATALAVLYPLLSEAVGPNGEFWHAATFLGSVFITIGWVVTSETAIRNSRRQHTITLITQHAFDPQRNANRELIRRYLPTYKTRLTPRIADFSDENHPLLKAIDLELNFYEFLAVGVHRDDLDEKLLRESLYSQFFSFHDQTLDYIKHWQGVAGESVWSHLSKMHLRWSRAPSPKASGG